MLRKIIAALALASGAASVAGAAIWPEQFFGFKRVSVEAAEPGAGPIWEEYGFEEGEIAHYSLDDREFTATAYRFNDATSAMAVYEWKRPLEAHPADLTKLAVQWDNGAFFAFGNYVFRFDGYVPSEEQVVGQLLIVPMLEQSQLPTWVSFVPSQGVEPGSRRFVIGPASLAEFEPRVSPSVAGFHFGVEAQFAEYQTPNGHLKLGVFNYPTPHIARERLPEFRMIPNTVVKRSGPLLAVVFDAVDKNAAETLLGQVNYRATITWDQYTFQRQPTLAEILLTGFLFIGALALAAVILGALFGGAKFWRWRNAEVEEDPMILLHLEDR